MLHITRLTDSPDLDNMAAAWDCMTHSVAFRHSTWLHAWWRHYQAGRELFVLRVANDHDEVVGIAPWYMETTVRHGRVIRPLGNGEVCSDYLSILATPEYEEGVAESLSQWLMDAANGRYAAEQRWDLLALDSVRADEILMDRLFQHLKDAGNYVCRRDATHCWRLELTETWDELYGRLSKNRRKNVRRMERRYLDSGRARLVRVEQREQVQPQMDVLIDLHQRRCTEQGLPGCFSSSAFTNFLRDAAEQLFARDLLGLYVLQLDGRPVAAEFCVASGDAMCDYLGGIDTEAGADSPGTVMHIALIKQLIDDGYGTLDFLRGDEPYKASWQANPCALVDVRVVPRVTTAQLRHQVWLAGDTVKHWIKTGLHLTGVY